MKNFKNYFFLAAFFILSYKGIAQQDPAYTQYMYNMSLINPAYATDELGMLKLGGLYRSQWAGIDGAPETANVFAHTPISKNMETGFSLVHDEIGNAVKETAFFADFAYVIPVSEKTKLSFGLKAGFSLFNTDFSNVVLGEGDIGNDNAFAENINEAFPNIGTGIFLFTEKYYVGLSAPNLLRNQHLQNENGTTALGVEEIHYFLTGGYVFELGPQTEFKPAFMMRAVSGAPLSVDVTANFRFFDRFELGAGYRLEDSFSGLVNIAILPELRLGYAYDHIYSNLGQFSSGSHEVMVLFDLDLLGIGYNKSPRFF